MAISRMQQPRQMYGLGSIVKKAVRGVKKVAKSPLGKAAIAVVLIGFRWWYLIWGFTWIWRCPWF